MGGRYQNFTVHDDYMTPKSAWEEIAHIIPKNKVIWEPFYGDGRSGRFLRELGFEVIHEQIDFYENNLGEIIVTNPAFSNNKKMFEYLLELNKPFILILPPGRISSQYFMDLFGDDDRMKILVPPKRIPFQKIVDGEEVEGKKGIMGFDCYYYCWNIPTIAHWDKIVWLKNTHFKPIHNEEQRETEVPIEEGFAEIKYRKTVDNITGTITLEKLLYV